MKRLTRHRADIENYGSRRGQSGRPCMKLFTDQQYRGFLILLPIAVLLVVLAVGIELAKKPRLLLDVVEQEERCDSLPLGMFNPNEDSYDK